MKEAGKKEVLLSQFPHAAGAPSKPSGPNTKLSLSETRKEEGEIENARFRIHLPDDNKFNKAVKDHSTRPTWTARPNSPSETHCARAGYDCLKAGGLPLQGQDDGQILPGTLEDLINDLLNNPSKLKDSGCTVKRTK